MMIVPEDNKSILDLLPNTSYDKILNQIRDGIFITDNRRKVVFWNQGAEDLTGIPKDELINKYCYKVRKLCWHGHKGYELCTNEKCPLKRAISTDYSGIYPHLVFMHTKWGIELPVSMSIGPLHDQNGKTVGGICVFRDMRDEYRQRKLAGEIQKRMITVGRIEQFGVRVDTLYKPVEEVGGDFIEAFFLDDKSMIATVADATGHGISASLFTVIYKTLLHSSFSKHFYPAEVLHDINQGFLNTTQIEGYYLTASIINYNPDKQKGTLCSAGNPPLLIFKKTRKGYKLKEILTTKSIMIGVEEDANFDEFHFTLKKNEFLLMFSDGLMEAECTNNEPYGIKGIEKFFEKYKGKDHLNDLSANVSKECKYVELLDDLSILKIEQL